MAFLAAISAGSGGGINPSSSQSAAITTGAFGGGTRSFGPVNIGSGSVAPGSTSYAPYVLGALALLVLGAVFFRK